MLKIELNESIDKIFPVICHICKISTRHKVISSVDEHGKESMGNGEWYQWHSEYQIIQCQGCENISFRSCSSNTEDYGEDGYNDTELIYPKRNPDTWNTKEFYNIPYNLKRIYRETIDCYNNDNFTLCGVGLRALVEGLCKENGIKNGNIEIVKQNKSVEIKRVSSLNGKINGLHEKGILTKQNAENLNEHKFLGDKAIHDLTAAPRKNELSLAIEIIENVFDTIYEIPQKAKQLRLKRLKIEEIF